MPTQLEELVGFLQAPQPHIRQIALENLVGYSRSQPSIFKPSGLKPIKNLKVLVRDAPKNAKNALTILVNLSDDPSVLEELTNDPSFLNLLMSRIIDTKFPHADLVAMLMSNMTKSESFVQKLFDYKMKNKDNLLKEVSVSINAMDQLVDCFVKGADKKLNKDANFDYLSYLFADVSRTLSGRQYFTTMQSYDGIIPISKLIVFTEHSSEIRRRGVANTIRNACFEIRKHTAFLGEDQINLLPYVLLPLCGPEEFPEDEALEMLSDLQFLPSTKKREPDTQILTTHLESLLLLTSTREARDYMRKVNVYPVLREVHLAMDDDDVREACDRVVQVLMADEGKEPLPDNLMEERHGKPDIEEADDEDKITEIL